MKYYLHLLLILACLFLFTSSYGVGTEAVVPLNSVKKLINVITVSTEGGNYTDPLKAVHSITDASAENPYLVVIGPGIYSLKKPLVMKEYVSIVGAGEGTTILTGAISSEDRDETSSVITGASNASISWLTVKNTGNGHGNSIAIYNNGTALDIRDVTASASGGKHSNFGVYNHRSSPTMMNVLASASGGTYSRGIENLFSSPSMTNVTASSSWGTKHYSLCIWKNDEQQ